MDVAEGGNGGCCDRNRMDLDLDKHPTDPEASSRFGQAWGERAAHMSGAGQNTEAGREAIRMIIASMDEEMEKLATSAGVGDRTAVAPLAALWRDLVRTLDLGPSPRVRLCPTCGGTCMAAATLCASCWSKLEPIPSSA